MPQVRKLKLLDLFSGIGGFSLGLERSGGFETVAFCEIEPFCQKVLAKHWSKVPCYDDIRTLTAERLAADGIAVDAICGGFPCQDLSMAGKQRGITGERSGLWGQYARIVGELRPQLFIVENVTNLLNGERGSWFSRFLRDVASLGYDAIWRCIPASEIGAAHGRDRVWIVAYPAGERAVRLETLLTKICSEIHNQGASPWCATEVGLLPSLAELLAGSDEDFSRNDDGLSAAMDGLKGCGNAVVPKIPELIGRAILASSPDLFIEAPKPKAKQETLL